MSYPISKVLLMGITLYTPAAAVSAGYSSNLRDPPGTFEFRMLSRRVTNFSIVKTIILWSVNVTS